MLFENEKREIVKLKAKPSIMQLASLVYKSNYPFAMQPNLDDLFEEMVTRSAQALGLIEGPRQVADREEQQDFYQAIDIDEDIKLGNILR